jgi:hypothetical protein
MAIDNVLSVRAVIKIFLKQLDQAVKLISWHHTIFQNNSPIARPVMPKICVFTYACKDSN